MAKKSFAVYLILWLFCVHARCLAYVPSEFRYGENYLLFLAQTKDGQTLKKQFIHLVRDGFDQSAEICFDKNKRICFRNMFFDKKDETIKGYADFYIDDELNESLPFSVFEGEHYNIFLDDIVLIFSYYHCRLWF